jgi:hypothetical protein
MAVTGQTVIDRLDQLFDDTSNALWTTTQKLASVNAAIDSAWPEIKDVEVDSSLTVASSTYEYTPTATPEVEWGFSVAYVTLGSNPKVLLRRVKQRQNGTAWTIILPADLTAEFNGKTLHLQYNDRIDRISAATESAELPLDYLTNYAAYWLCLSQTTKAAHFDVKPYAELVGEFRQAAERSKLRHRRGDIPHMIGIGHDFGTGQSTVGRYGENIVTNP